MTKKKFLDTLAESLAGNLPTSEIEENIRYYKDYIENGEESEEKALETLGDPHLIARTIIDSFKISKGPMADFYTEQARDEYKRGAFNEDTDNTDYGQYENGHMYPKIRWYHKLIFVLIIIAVIALLLVLGGFIAVVIVRVILPVLLVVIVLKFISNNFGKG